MNCAINLPITKAGTCFIGFTRANSSVNCSFLSKSIALLRFLEQRLDFCNCLSSCACFIHRLLLAGMLVPEEWIGTILIAGLPFPYKPMIMQIKNYGAKTEYDSSSTLYGKKKNFHRKRNLNRTNVTNQPGYFIKDCPSKKDSKWSK
uniref:Uncharacterized protein n=1 Tax=Megaselia scalaris TaxID=36166 RepID=T1GRR9_MEGSC